MKSVDWAVSKKDPATNVGDATNKGGNKTKEAGKGDKPRHNIRRYDEGYDQINWNRRKK